MNRCALVLQIQDKDAPILSHLVDIRVVNLRDDADVSTSNKHDKDEDDDEEDELPKVYSLLRTIVALFVCCSTYYSCQRIKLCALRLRNQCKGQRFSNM